MKQDGDWSGDAPLSKQIRGSEKKSLTNAWLGLGVPLIMSGFFFGWGHMPFFMAPGVPNPIAGVIGLVSVFILGRIVWETIRLKRFGDPVLDLTQVPVPLGGTVEGQITLGAGLTTAPSFKMKLQCIRRELQRGGKNDRWIEKILWEEEKTVSLLLGGVLPVSMSVPPDQEETNSDDPFNQILWRLTVQAAFRGPSFLEKYEIPVEGRTSVAQKIADEREPSDNTQPPLDKKGFLSMLPFLIVGLGIFVGGIYLLTFGVTDLATACTSGSWPTVSGQVRTSYPPEDSAIFVNWKDSEFAYTFDVNGTTYTGHVIYPHLFWQRSKTLEMSKTYSSGSTVTVYYSPDHPENSCLLPGTRAGAFQRLILALLVMTVGFLFAASAALAPRDGVMSGNTMTFREGSTGSKVMGYSIVAILVWGVALWWVT